MKCLLRAFLAALAVLSALVWLALRVQAIR